jgi:hypothetical protein
VAAAVPGMPSSPGCPIRPNPKSSFISAKTDRQHTAPAGHAGSRKYLLANEADEQR